MNQHKHFEEIAGLHTRSWQRFYRGIYSDSYLDGALAEDHRTQWYERLSAFDENNQHLQLLYEADCLIGFTYAECREEDDLGVLIENLHVDLNYQRMGMGRKLLARCAEWAMAKSKPMHLEVFSANKQAVDFYARCGGEKIQEFMQDLTGGGDALTLVYRWRNPGVLTVCPHV